MKTQGFKNYSWDTLTLGICIAIMAMAVIVLVGWHAHIRAAVQIFPGFIPMQYNSALCFLAMGVGGVGLLTGRRILLLLGGSFAAIMGAAVIVEYAAGVSLGIDTFFFYSWERSLSAHPGRMAITTAISFFLIGGSLGILAARQGAYAIFAIMNSVPLSLALTSLIGYSFQITYVLPFNLGTQMALHTSAALLAYGVSMLGYAWKHAERGADGMPKWGAGIGVTFLPALLVGASALFPKQSWQVVLFESFLSILGLALITLAVRRMTQAKVAYKGLLMIAVPLILLLIFVGLVVRVKHQSESAEALALRSTEVIGVSQSLLARIAEAESAARGYLITGDESFHNSYERAAQSVTQATAQFRGLVSSDPQQDAIARKIEYLTAKKMNRLSQSVDMIKTDKEQVEKRFKEGSGTALMNEIRTELGVFTREEERIGVERRLILDASWQRLSWLLVAGTAAAILLATILSLLFSGSISWRLQQLRDSAINVTAGKELAPPLTGRDEIAELDRAFRDMADSLDEVTRREKAVIDGTTDGVFVKDLDHRYLMMNRGGADQIGKTVAEIIGTSVHDIFAPESAQRIVARDNEILASDKTVTYELKATTKAGLERTYLATRGPYRDRRGNVVGMIGVNRDISASKRSGQALATSERRYRALVDEGQGLICTHDLDGKLLSVNPAAAESLGYTPKEMVGRNLVEYATPAVQLIFPRYLQRISSEQKVNGFFNLLNKQGEERIWMYRNARIAEPGDLTYVLGYAQDVTESKNAEDEMRKLTQRLSLATKVGNIGIWDWDFETNTLDWDERMREIYGVAEGTAIDRDLWAAAVVAEDLATAEAALERTLSLKSQEVAEFRIVRPDGSLRYLQTAQGAIMNRAGAVVRVIGLNVDITERKLIEGELKQNELELVEAQHIAQLGSWSWDIAANTTIWSEALYHIYGLERADFPATFEGYLSLVHPEDRENVSAMVETALRTCQGSHYEHRIIWPDKSIRSHHVNLKVLLDDRGQPVKMFGTSQDITDQVHLEEELKEARDTALESVRLKSEFLANMSHEIRTPMNGVIGMTDLLLETELSNAQREYTDTIQSSAEILLTIINDILDFSKIEAGLMRFDKIDFELRASVESTVELLAKRAQAKGLEVASLVYRDVPTALRGDPGRLRQVLTNLIGNAVKFTDQGEVVVRVTKVSETASHVLLRFEIQDTGIGVPAEAQRGLFQPFTQADGSTTRKYGGTGLGLAISKQLVELMAGEIGVESASNGGSKFWFTGRFEKQLSSAATVKEPAGNLAGTRVLIVDDNATNRNILKHQTSSWGMIATEADSGKQALELLRAGAINGEPYDIAVLDLMMPDMDGFELAEAIKSDGTIARVTLVLLPSFVERGHSDRARRAGIVAYLQKPVRQSQLYDCLTGLKTQSESRPGTVSQLDSWHSISEPELRPKGQAFSNVRILIAEDNLVNQRVALGQLSNLGYRAKAVSNGLELLKALEKEHVDIILMDCQMPEMDGYAATSEIRRREGTARHTTIIAMTANALSGDQEKCMAAGMDDYLSKPVKSEVLRLKLELWIKPGPSGNGVKADKKSAPQTRAGVIDQTQLASLRAIQQPGAPDFVTELIDLFLAEATSDFKALQQALTRDDGVEIRRVAHRLKGASANMGITHMAALSEKLESKDSAKDPGKLITQLKKEFKLVCAALKAERRET